MENLHVLETVRDVSKQFSGKYRNHITKRAQKTTKLHFSKNRPRAWKEETSPHPF